MNILIFIIRIYINLLYNVQDFYFNTLLPLLIVYILDKYFWLKRIFEQIFYKCFSREIFQMYKWQTILNFAHNCFFECYSSQIIENNLFLSWTEERSDECQTPSIFIWPESCTRISLFLLLHNILMFSPF